MEDKQKNTSRHEVPQPSGKDQLERIDQKTKQRITDEPDSLGLDIDGTNPGSNAHPIEEDAKEINIKK